MIHSIRPLGINFVILFLLYRKVPVLILENISRFLNSCSPHIIKLVLFLSGARYNSSYIPTFYQRTKTLLYSGIKVQAKPGQAGYREVVYMDTDSLDNYLSYGLMNGILDFKDNLPEACKYVEDGLSKTYCIIL